MPTRPRFAALFNMHAGFLVLILLAAPAIVHFTSSDVISSVGDDTVSYVMLARYFLDPANAINREWVGYQTHFPPLFPLLLALTGGAGSFAIAHTVVALLAVLALVLVYRYAAAQLASDGGGLAVAAFFLAMPTAWVSVHSILSEPLFLLTTLAALHYYESRLGGAQGPRGQWIVFGVLLASACLTRSAGFLLVAAFGIHALVRIARGERKEVWRFLLPALPLGIAWFAWLAIRPTAGGPDYQSTFAILIRDVAAGPLDYVRRCVDVMFGGWVRSFSADSNVHVATKVVCAVVGCLALAGAALRAWRNHVDGWYVLLTLPVIFLLLFPEDNARRLLYPIVPLLLLHASIVLWEVAKRVNSTRDGRRLIVAAVTAVAGAICIPAWLVLQSKGLDRQTIYSGQRYAYSEITPYHTTLAVSSSRRAAAQHAAVLSGLEALQWLTPEDARVMWVRPDYVAVMGKRRGVAWYYDWDRAEFLRQVASTRTDYLVVSSLLKTDMRDAFGPPTLTLQWALEFSRPVFTLRNAMDDGYEVAVLQIDRARLAGVAGW